VADRFARYYACSHDSAELRSSYYEKCRSEKDTPLDDCINRVDPESEDTPKSWSSGDSYAAQSFRVARAILPWLGIVLMPPLLLLLLGASVRWGFRKKLKLE
jgi:hypothetical protein